MEIIFHGEQDSSEISESIAGIIRMFHERYHIDHFREIHLSLTLVDDTGSDVELVDSNTSQAYRVFEVYRQGESVRKGQGRPMLKLVIDNTQLLKD